MRFIASFFLFVLLTTGVSAQDRPNTILVMDGSGSMWGQIDGVAKITIAQEVITELLATLPEEQRLGLTVYGHRQRGDCTDIETVVAPAAGTRDAIATAVAGITPLGKTPMTDAIIAAAEALRYTEDSATVILVSDGVETCNPDPCAAARLLEEAGIDFTAHVIGFDISDPEALNQMQCIADETGGRFITADNAGELTAALNTVTVEPAPVAVEYTFRAISGAGGPLIDGLVQWEVFEDGQMLTDGEQGNPMQIGLLPGAHSITAFWVEKEVQESVDFVVNDSGTVTVVFPEMTPEATVFGPETAALGSTIMVEWTGPGNDVDFVSVALPGEHYNNSTYTREGNPVALQMPPEAGEYQLEYRIKTSHDIIATQAITITPVDVSLDAPETAIAGETITVNWTGPDYERDFVSVGIQGERYDNYTYTREGSSLDLLMPTEVGTYEIRYQLAQDHTIIATRLIVLTEAQTGLVGPDTAVAGSTITVGWEGPDYDRDYISVGKVGERYLNYTYTREGNPTQLLLPTEPGEYELRYQLGQDAEILLSQPITVTALDISLDAPDTATVGETITVTWVGPDYERDFIGVGPQGERYDNYTYTREGNPAQLVMPTEPGEYTIRYQFGQGHAISTSHNITVSALKIQLSAPDTAIAGSTITVGWDGPDYPRDFISVGLNGERYIQYTYTRDGNPTELLMPTEPGDYEIRYQLGQAHEVVFVQPITVTEVTAQLVAPPTVAVADGTVTVGWDGPNYDRDFVSIGEVGEDGYIHFAYTDQGNPSIISLPETSGSYELRYQTGQNRQILTRIPIEVTK